MQISFRGDVTTGLQPSIGNSRATGRGLTRLPEIGIRLSIGAGRVRLIRQLLTEALAGLGRLIGVAGAVVKLLLWWSSGLGVLSWDNVALLAGAGLARTAAVLASLGPSRRAATLDPNTVLRSD